MVPCSRFGRCGESGFIPDAKWGHDADSRLCVSRVRTNVFLACISLSLAAALIWASTDVIDSTIVRRTQLSPISYLLCSGCATFILGGALIPFLAPLSTSPEYILYPLVSGMLFGLATGAYFYALQSEPTAIVAALLQLSAIFSVVVGICFFRESLGPPGYVGVVCIAAAGAVIAVRRDPISHLFRPRGIVFGVVAAALFSLGISVQHVALAKLEIPVVFFWSRLAFAVFCFAVATTMSRTIVADARKLSASLLLVVGLAEVGNFVAFRFLVRAQASGPLVLVASLLAVQPLLVFAVSKFVRCFSARVDTGRPMTLTDWTVITLVVLGAVLVVLS